VPVSNLPILVDETKKDLAKCGIPSTIVGHVGDGKIREFILSSADSDNLAGNFHALLMFRSDEELPVIRDAVHRIVIRAIGLDGTCEIGYHLLFTSANALAQARGSME
jgi:D-lactate dehydrogenase (cytochrome)